MFQTILKYYLDNTEKKGNFSVKLTVWRVLFIYYLATEPFVRSPRWLPRATEAKGTECFKAITPKSLTAVTAAVLVAGFVAWLSSTVPEAKAQDYIEGPITASIAKNLPRARNERRCLLIARLAELRCRLSVRSQKAPPRSPDVGSARDRTSLSIKTPKPRSALNRGMHVACYWQHIGRRAYVLSCIHPSIKPGVQHEL